MLPKEPGKGEKFENKELLEYDTKQTIEYIVSKGVSA